MSKTVDSSHLTGLEATRSESEFGSDNLWLVNVSFLNWGQSSAGRISA